MRKPDYFTTPERQEAARAAAFSWLGTPFRERHRIKGPLGGVDCAGFVGSVLFECGAIPEAISVPPYDLEHAKHSEESILVKWFEQPAVRARVRVLDPEEQGLPGDIVFIRTARAVHHMGLLFGVEVLHAVRPAGLVRMPLTVPGFSRQIASRLRLLEP